MGRAGHPQDEPIFTPAPLVVFMVLLTLVVAAAMPALHDSVLERFFPFGPRAYRWAARAYRSISRP
jgi:hypothetical protein